MRALRTTVASALIAATATLMFLPSRASSVVPEITFASVPTALPTVVAGETVASWVDGHPLDAAGFVLDGSPQLDDAHCVGNVYQRFACLAARRPPGVLLAFVEHLIVQQLLSSGQGVPCGVNVARWYPQLAQYPWPIAEMEKIMCRESGGDPFARNRYSGACGLMQLLPCPAGGLDGYTNIALAYTTKYAPSGLGPWSETA